MEDNEQERYFALEQRQEKLLKELEVTRIERDANKSKVITLQENIITLKDQCETNVKSTLNSDTYIKKLEENIKIYENEDWQERYRRKSDELDRISEIIKEQSSELILKHSQLRECQINLSENKELLLPTQLQLTKVTRENELLESRLKLMETEVQTKTSEILALRNKLSSTVGELKEKIRVAEEDRDENKKKTVVLTERCNSQNSKIDDYINKFRISEEEYSKQYGTFTRELEGIKKISDLRKDNYNEAILKIEELESNSISSKDNYENQILLLKNNLQVQVENVAIIRDEKKVLDNKITLLEKEIFDLKSSNELNHQNIIPIDEMEEVSNTISINSSSNISSHTNIKSVTEMYTKLVNTEKLLAAEKNEKSKVDLTLQHILKEIEKKTPEITNQRRDYNRILESHNHLTKKIEQLVSENNSLKDNIKNLNKKTNDALANTASLEISNKDLSKQINHLLNNQIDSKLIGYGSSLIKKTTPSLIENDTDSEVVTDHLLTFNNVSELQAKNEQLLKVIRKLSMDQDKYNDLNEKNNDKDDNNSELLNQTLMDINQMKEDRKRMEDMIHAIINDRDLYKAMVEQSDLSRSKQTSISSIASNSNIDINNDSYIKITNLENEKKRLLNRISKLETSDKYSSETLDQIKSECVVLRIQSSNSTNELRFQKEITDRLEENLKLLQNETTLSLKRRTELEKIILENQNNLRLKEDKITINNEKIKSLENIIKRLEIDIEVSKSSETRLIEQINDQRDEIKKQQLFTDSIRRIESSLSSKIEEDKSELLKDKDIMLKNIDELKKQISDRRLITDENIRTSDEELRSLRKQLDDLLKEMVILKEENTTISGNSKLSQERCNLLEKQLTKEQERNTALQGSQVLDNVIQSELSEKEILLDRANAQIIFLSQQIVSSEEHVEKFRLISNESEVRFQEYRTRAELIKKELEKELLNNKNLLDTSMNDLTKLRQAHLSTVKEIEESHELINKTIADKNEAVLSITNELTIAKENSNQAIRQMEQLKADIIDKQNKAKTSYQNYERELQLHAKAESLLREKEDELDLLKEKLSNIEQTCTNLSSEAIMKEKAIQENMKISNDSIEYWKDRVNNLNSSNEVLEKEIKRLELRSLNANSALIMPSSDSGDLAITTTNIDTTTDSVLTTEEILELKKTNIELHQVVKFLNEKERFMKKEYDMKIFECSNLENEINRSKSSYNLLVRKYDEIKVELQNERNNLNVDVSSENFNKIKLELKENQDIINSTREFNQLLRSNNEELTAKNNNLESSLAELKQLNAPNEKKIRQLLIDKKQLEEDKLKLIDTIEVDHQRVKRLLTNFNEIDPDVHKLLQSKYDETIILFENSKQVNDKLIKEKEILIEENKILINKYELLVQTDKKEQDKLKEEQDKLRSEKESKQKEVDELINSKQLIEKNAESLRDKCRQFTTKVKELTQAKNLEIDKNKTLSAEIEELKASNPSQHPVTKAVAVPGVVKKTIIAAKTIPVVKAPPVDVVATTTTTTIETATITPVANAPVSLKRPVAAVVTTSVTNPTPVSAPSRTISSTTVVTDKDVPLNKKSKVTTPAVVVNVVTEQPIEPVITPKVGITELDDVIVSNKVNHTTIAALDEKLSSDITEVEVSNAVECSVEMISSDSVVVEVVNTAQDITPSNFTTEIVQEEVAPEKTNEEKLRESIKQKLLKKKLQSVVTPAVTAATIPHVVTETLPVKSMEDSLKEKLLLKKKNLLQQQTDAKKIVDDTSPTLTDTASSSSVKRNASEMVDVVDESKKMKPVVNNDATLSKNAVSIFGAKPAAAINTSIAGIFGSKASNPTLSTTSSFGSGNNMFSNKAPPSSGSIILNPFAKTVSAPVVDIPVTDAIIPVNETSIETTTDVTVIDTNYDDDKEDGKFDMEETHDVIIDEPIVNIDTNDNDAEISLLLMEEDINNDDTNNALEVVDEHDVDLEEVTEEIQEDSIFPTSSSFANIKPPSPITIIPLIGNGKVGKLSIPALLQPNTSKSFLNSNAPVFKSINTSSSLFNKTLSNSTSNDSLISSIVPPSPTVSPRVSIFNSNVGVAAGIFKSFSSSDLNKSEDSPKITLLSYNSNQSSAPFTIGKNKVEEVDNQEEVINNEDNNIEISMHNVTDITDNLDDDITVDDHEDNEEEMLTSNIDGDNNNDNDEDLVMEETSVIDEEIPIEEAINEDISIEKSVIEEKSVIKTSNTRKKQFPVQVTPIVVSSVTNVKNTKTADQIKAERLQKRNERFSQGGNSTTPTDNSETTNKVVKGGKKKIVKKMIKKSSQGGKPSDNNEDNDNEGDNN